MKKLSSIFYMWVGFGTAIVSVLAMFIPFISCDSTIYPATHYFFNSPSGSVLGNWTSFVGFMLILAAGLAMGILALPFVQPSAKAEKIVLISSFVALVVGFILVGFTGYLFEAMNANKTMPIIGHYYPGFYIALICAGLSAGSCMIAVKLDW